MTKTPTTLPTLFILLALVVASPSGPIHADATAAPIQTTGSDLGKELRWREQIVDSLMDGEAVDLTAGEATFLGLYTEAEEDAGRGAIIVHGIGVHPNWPQVVYPLRTALPRDGWSTLAIQMPVLENEATGADYAPLIAESAPRLAAAVAYLKAHGAERIVIVAHSLGATMVNDALAARSDDVDAYVAIGMSSSGLQAGRDNVELVRRITIPMLDLFGENDLPAVVSGARERAETAAANPGYHQVQIPGADHFFEGYEEPLIETVVQWLDQTVPRP
jgi:pimeloyl-ACP methyl ester carboxylesterase